MAKTESSPQQERDIQAVVQFSVLLHARSRDLFQEAARVQGELKRLGVEVRFRRPAAGREATR